MLHTFGFVHVWPSEFLRDLKDRLQRTLSILENMLAPPNEDWGFLDMWDANPAVVASVRDQMDALTLTLHELR